MSISAMQAGQIEQARIEAIEKEFAFDRSIMIDALAYGWSIERTRAEDQQRGRGPNRTGSILESRISGKQSTGNQAAA